MKATWRVMVEGAAEEALLAVDLYNQTKRPRRLEAYFVHMHLAWLYLLHARFRRDGIDYHYRKPNGRFEKIDGEPRTWELAKCVAERWGENETVRKNLELTIGLRNKIEHRYDEATAAVTSGYANALLVNFEEELTSTFGAGESLGDRLRFPVFVGTFTMDSARQWASAQTQVPRKTREFLARFTSDLGSDVMEDPHFEFRLNLVQKLGSKSDADASISFVRQDQLTDRERKALEKLSKTGQVVVRDRLQPVTNLGLMKPTAAAAAIEARIPFRFRPSTEFPRAWRKLGCRPPAGDKRPEHTDEKYCVYDDLHGDYAYKPAFVDKVVRETSTRNDFRKFVGLTATEKPKAPVSRS